MIRTLYIKLRQALGLEMANQLSTKTIKILQATAPALSVHGDAIATRFYDILFTKHPDQRKNFNMSHHRIKDGKVSSQVIHARTYICFTNLSQLYYPFHYHVVYFLYYVT